MAPNMSVSFPIASDGDFSDIQNAFQDSDEDIQGRERMEFRRNSPKIRRRKKRSKFHVDLTLEPLVEADDDDCFYQSSKSPQEIYDVLQESTKRLQRATDGFLQAAEALASFSLPPTHGSVDELFADQGHPVSNEIKDAIDEGFYTLTSSYNNHYLRAALCSHEALELQPLGEQTKALLMAFLPLPLLPDKFMEVNSYLGYIIAQQEGSRSLLSSDDHAVALFYNVIRYLGDHHDENHRDILNSLSEPLEVMFDNKRALLRELLRGVGREQIEACRGSHMYKVLNIQGKKIGLRAFRS